MTKCPFCQQEIEPDSFYCDQCGETLNICPSGHGFKKGKICNECGTKLVAASATQTSADNTPQKTYVPPTATVVQNAAGDDVQKTVRPEATIAEPCALVCSTLNARMNLINGGIIGRRNGEYTHIFANQGYVSGTHARLQKNGNQWEIVDLDSSNGTSVNNNKLSPNVPCTFNIGDTIAFYDIKFIVE